MLLGNFWEKQAILLHLHTRNLINIRDTHLLNCCISSECLFLKIYIFRCGSISSTYPKCIFQNPILQKCTPQSVPSANLLNQAYPKLPHLPRLPEHISQKETHNFLYFMYTSILEVSGCSTFWHPALHSARDSFPFYFPIISKCPVTFNPPSVFSVQCSVQEQMSTLWLLKHHNFSFDNHLSGIGLGISGCLRC